MLAVQLAAWLVVALTGSFATYTLICSWAGGHGREWKFRHWLVWLLAGVLVGYIAAQLLPKYS